MLFRFLISLIWLLNGFYCKLLNLVPRHQLIVSRILGPEHAFIFTKLIGLSEIGIAFWIVSRYKSKICCWVQVLLILTMNAIEFIKAPDLLLFGRGNIIPAIFLICAIIWTEYFTQLNRKHV